MYNQQLFRYFWKKLLGLDFFCTLKVCFVSVNFLESLLKCFLIFLFETRYLVRFFDNFLFFLAWTNVILFLETLNILEHPVYLIACGHFIWLLSQMNLRDERVLCNKWKKSARPHSQLSQKKLPKEFLFLWVDKFTQFLFHQKKMCLFLCI